jgi:CO/xanthine dehydrogenase Mo-binding subunit
MEEIRVNDGRIENPGFTDYLIPTFADAPEVEAVFLEENDPWGPFGAKGIAESPTVSSTAAVVAAIRDATGVPLRRVPVKPQDIAMSAAEHLGPQEAHAE